MKTTKAPTKTVAATKPETLTSEALRVQFKRHGLKFTAQRYEVYCALAGSTDHPAAEQLFLTVKNRNPAIARNTVYKTLEALKSVGIASEVSLWHDRARYDANGTAHHHLVCLKCRRIEDLNDVTLNQLEPPAGIDGRFRITGHLVEFHGICVDCSPKRSLRALKVSKPAPSPQGGKHGKKSVKGH